MVQESYITDEVKATIGMEKIGIPELIELKAIRDYAKAINWPDPPDQLYVDEEYAKKTRHGGIIAPWSFYTSIDYVTFHNFIRQIPMPKSLGGVNAGNDYEYFQPIRPGDVITATNKIVSISEREGQAGKLVFVITDRSFNNQKGELVGISHNTLVRWY